MGLPDDKREWLKGKIGEDEVEALEAALADKAKKAEGMEYKASETEEAETPEAQDDKDTVEAAGVEGEPLGEPEEPEEQGDPEPEPQYATVEAVGQAVGEVVGELKGQIEALATQMGELAGTVKELQKSEDERIAEKAELTPAASLAEIIRNSVIGKSDTKVDGRTTLGKAGPKQADAPADGRTGIPLLDSLMSGGDWRDSMEA